MKTSQLELDLTNARKQIDEGLDKFTKAALNLSDQGGQAKVEVELDKVEKQIRRLVNHLAVRDYEKNYHETWIRVYEKMGSEFDYNPAALNKDPTRPHLDQCREDGMVPKLLEAVQRLIAKPYKSHA